MKNVFILLRKLNRAHRSSNHRTGGLRFAVSLLFITLIAVIVLSMAACGKNKGYDYSKLLEGDLSDFAGHWKAGFSNFIFRADGTYGDFVRISDVRMESGGYYTWSVSSNSSNNVIEMFLFPVGIDIIVDGEIIQTDKTKVRILTGKYKPGISDIYYLEASSAEIAAAEAKAFQAALSEGYAKLLNGDYSQFTAGYWVMGAQGIQLRADGTFNDEVAASVAHRNDDGSYSWGMWEKGGGGWAAVLFPVGVDARDVKSDTTKVRLWMGQDWHISNDDGLYYYYPAQTAFYYATSNLRLRSAPDTSKNNRIAGILEGDSVALLETGKTDNIDGITAPWYMVKTADGTIGWVFSGYLTALSEFYYNLETTRLHWYQTSKTEWTEEDPDGNKNYFVFEKNLVLDGVRGTVVKRSSAYTDTGFRLFIPNKGEENNMIRCYDPEFYGTSEWKNLGNMTYLN